MRNAGKLLIVAMALVSSSAWAGPLALWVGQTTFLGFPGRHSQVEVSNPWVVEVKTTKTGAELHGLYPGVTKVTLRLRGGETYEFDVHVTPSGAEVYSTSRAESEHSGFSLPSPTS
ncbi:MAG: pilus assembly protein N-terminal domain-containing protein [Myxococcaceae bacterium]|nr:pilus assembly protein N-terminal domain-containing protein [Myxococcaceae bacterium]